MRKALKIAGWSVVVLLLVVVLLPLGIGTILYHTADLKEPAIALDTAAYRPQCYGDTLRTVGANSVLKNRYGQWETRVQGAPVERGALLGALLRSEMEYQEQVFVGQIQHLVPSERYLWFLHKLTSIFNRRMAHHIPNEFREEIYGLSLFCNHRFDAIGTPYSRQLNYHAAHDIGHAMQEYMLVGCSAFAVWGEASADGELLVGRNFDFWVGDDFARNKVVLLVEPANGYRFLSVTWPGMVGVVSGMNERGLTVTINAAKGAIPTSSAMPISLLAREILQYAATIDEAYAIAERAETFVSESLLIASAADQWAAVIEKSPTMQSLYTAENERVIVANHYQSEAFAHDATNLENIATTDSPYRAERIAELLDVHPALTPREAVSILRNCRGLGDREIGLTNEKAINQCIAHHAVVFQPGQLRMWLSTDPWQAGRMVCYDLRKMLTECDPVRSSWVDEQHSIEADTAFLKDAYPRAVTHRKLSAAIRERLKHHEEVPRAWVDSLVRNNPHHYSVYELAGDVAASVGQTTEALEQWRQALGCELPRKAEQTRIEQKLTEYGTR